MRWRKLDGWTLVFWLNMKSQVKHTTTVVLFSNIVDNISSVVFSCRHFSKLSVTASNGRGSWQAGFCWCSFLFMQIMIKIISIRMVSHFDSLWNRGTRELGNSLLIWKFVPPTRYSHANQIHFHMKGFERWLVLKQRHKVVANSHILNLWSSLIM